MLPKPNDVTPYEDETLEKIQFEHLMIALIILEVGTIISIFVFWGEMVYFARRLKKTGIEEAMPDDNDIEMSNDNDNVTEGFFMDEKKYATWKRQCKIFFGFCIFILVGLVSGLLFQIFLLIKKEQELTTTTPGTHIRT